MSEEARRRHIIGSTIAVLARDGLVETSLSRVATEAKVAKGIICYYFGSKSGLFDAVLDAVRQEMLCHALAATRGKVRPWDKVTAFFLGHVDYVHRHRHEILALRHLASTSAGGSALTDHHGIWRDQRTWLSETFYAGQGSGVFQAFDVATIAMAMSGALESGVLQWAYDAAFDLDGYARQLLALFESGVCHALPIAPDNNFVAALEEHRPQARI